MSSIESKLLSEKKLLSQGLVEAFDLAGGGRRIGSRQQMADPVVQTDAVEEHVGGPSAEPPGEDLAVEFPIGVKSSRAA
jgi:hypothetical protein